MKTPQLIPILVIIVSLATSVYAEKSTVTIGDRSFDSLTEALDTAQTGQKLIISGTHEGNFVVDKSLKLTGTKDATLDAKGKGTVLLIVADGVVVENLKISGSGKDKNTKLIWGDSGILVKGNETILRGLEVSNNDWGVLFFGGEKSALSSSLIQNNSRDGIKVMGGIEHQLFDNRVVGNLIGILVDTRFGKATEMVIPGDMSDLAQIRRLHAFMKTASHSKDVDIRNNEIRGNGMYGIHIFGGSNDIRVRKNTISLTGKSIKPDPEFIAARATWIASALRISHEQIIDEMSKSLGSGITLHCGPKKCVIEQNRCDQNAGHGIELSVTSDHKIIENHLTANRFGLSLKKARNNQIQANLVVDNTDHGIAIEVDIPVSFGVPRSSDNTLSDNHMSNNMINAYDGSTRLYTLEEISSALEKNPPPQVPKKTLADPKRRLQYAKDLVKRQKPGTNLWDNGNRGNYYDDFDESSEGFEDKDGNGIGDKARSIPGGKSLDRYPLKLMKLDALEEIGPES